MTPTTNLGLPIYGNNDVPKWGDTNSAFEQIDNFICSATAGIHSNRGEILMFQNQIKGNLACVFQYDAINAKYITDIYNNSDVAIYATIFFRHAQNLISANGTDKNSQTGTSVAFNPIQSGYTPIYKESTLVHSSGYSREAFADGAWYIDNNLQDVSHSYYFHVLVQPKHILSVNLGVSG